MSMHKVDPEEAANFFDTIITEYEDLCDGHPGPTSQEIDEFCAKALRGFLVDYYAFQLAITTK